MSWDILFLYQRLCNISVGLVKVTAFLIVNKVFFNNRCTITHIFKFYCSNVTGLHVQDMHGGTLAALLSCPLLPHRYFIPWWPTYITSKGTNNSKDFRYPERSPQCRHKHYLKSHNTHQVFIKMVGFVIVVVVLL